MPAAPWLTVAVPVYNVEPYLRTCVESLLAGADEGVELLLIDDASTDGSAALMKHLATEATAKAGAQVRWLEQPANRGVSAARNRLIDEARGEYLWFVDGDDCIRPEALARLRTLLAVPDVPDAPDIVYFDYQVLRARPKLKYRLRGELHRPGMAGPSRCRRLGGPLLLQALLATGNLFVWTFVARRALWQANTTSAALRFPLGRSFEDISTVPHLPLRATSAWHEPEPWVLYRRRDDSLSGQMSASKVADLSRALIGFRAELLRRWPQADERTRAAVAHQAARNLIAAQRHARRLTLREAELLLPQTRRDFIEIVGEDQPLLMRHYLRRGWWWRAWSLHRALSD